MRTIVCITHRFCDMHSINEDEIELTVSDDGVGIPEDLDIRDAESMGLHLVKVLSEQTLEGKIDLDRTEGTRFHLLLKRAKYKRLYPGLATVKIA